MISFLDHYFFSLLSFGEYMVDIFVLLIYILIIQLSFSISEKRYFQILMLIGLSLYPLVLINDYGLGELLILFYTLGFAFFEINRRNLDSIQLTFVYYLPLLVSLILCSSNFVNLLIFLAVLRLSLLNINTDKELLKRAGFELVTSSLYLFIFSLACFVVGGMDHTEVISDLGNAPSVSLILTGGFLLACLKIGGAFNRPIFLLPNHYLILIYILISYQVSPLFPNMINSHNILIPILFIFSLWSYSFYEAIKCKSPFKSGRIFHMVYLLMFFSSLYAGEKHFYLFFVFSLLMLGLSSFLNKDRFSKVKRFLILGLPLSPPFIFHLLVLNEVNYDLTTVKKIPLILFLILPGILYMRFFHRKIDESI